MPRRGSTIRLTLERTNHVSGLWPRARPFKEPIVTRNKTIDHHQQQLVRPLLRHPEKHGNDRDGRDADVRQNGAIDPLRSSLNPRWNCSEACLQTLAPTPKADLAGQQAF
jgi:hypothetical protein